MKRYALVAVLGSSLLGVPMLAGCDRTVSEEKSTTTGPNGTAQSEKKTVEHSDGSVSTTTEKKSTNNP
jgi:hypothetical protein